MSSETRFVATISPPTSSNCIIADAHTRFVDSKVTGSVKNTVGKMEETIGDVTGLESWKTSGKARQAEGEVEHKKAEAQGYVEGTTDRIAGNVESVVGSVTGDTSQEVSGA